MDRVYGIDPPPLRWSSNPLQALRAVRTGQCRLYLSQDLFKHVFTLALACTSKHKSHSLGALAPVFPHHKVYSSDLYFMKI